MNGPGKLDNEAHGRFKIGIEHHLFSNKEGQDTAQFDPAGVKQGNIF